MRLSCTRYLLSALFLATGLAHDALAIGGPSPSPAPGGMVGGDGMVGAGGNGTGSAAYGGSTRSFGTVDRNAVLNPGDLVSISIAEDREPPVMQRVTDTGELDFPYIGRITASKKTCAEVAAEAKRRLEAKYYYHATVEVGIDQRNEQATMGKIYLAGLVKAAGPQQIAEGEKLTVSEAIVRAGGFDKFADDRHVKVTRGGKTYVVDVKRILQDGRTDDDIQVEDGDHIYVSQKLINF